jgi:hypothetical protein
MPGTARPARLAGCLLPLALTLGPPASASAQVAIEGFVTGQASQAWATWRQACEALLARDSAKAEAAFGELVAQGVSPLRLALCGDRLLQQRTLAGALVLLEQDAEAEALGENGRKVYAAYQTGVEQMNQADDGFYFCFVGQFPVAAANFQALLRSDPDPVALLEFVDQNPRREEILVLVSRDPIVGEAARRITKLLAAGERLIRADPTRILQHIERLAGPPRQFENSVERIKDSGEYAIPFLILTLRDREKSDLVQPIVRMLPQIGRPALNPLVAALRMDDQATKRFLIQALGRIGYVQAVPYLQRLRDATETSPEVRVAVEAALAELASRGAAMTSENAARSFLELADQYYDDSPSLRADPRTDTANVWYWRDDLLQNVEVPTPIFNEVMCMRACEEALLLDPDLKPALALWLAANFRREAQLPEDASDPTRPENYPSAAYFAQAAGPEYNLLALARAVDDGDPAVALGAVEALRKTAGTASVLLPEAGRQPLAEALSFGDRMVRVRAALALGGSLPVRAFHNYQNLMPVLAEALLLHGGARNALVVDPDAETANHVASALRAEGFKVVLDGGLLGALEKARSELPGVDLITIASDVVSPDLRTGLSQLRGEFRFASVPVVIVAKPGTGELVGGLIRSDFRLGHVPPQVGPDELRMEFTRVGRVVGATHVTPEVGLGLAHEAADVLVRLALTNNPLFKVEMVQPAILAALGTDDPALRVKLGGLLAFIGSREAQEPLAQIALDEAEPEAMRVAMFAALADGAKRFGNRLGEEIVRRLIAAAESHENLTIRTAASQALGALNLPGNPASVIIRNQYRG